MPFTYTPGVGGGWVVGTAEPTVPPFGEWTYTIQPVGGWELEDMTQPATFNGGFASIGPQGPAGAAGASATVAIGTTTTGAAGSPATVTNSGTGSAAVFNFTIPQGIQGEKGDKGDTGDSGVAYATSPLAYDALTKTVSIDPNYKPNPFDQTLDTTSSVNFNSVTVSDGVTGVAVTTAGITTLQFGMGSPARTIVSNEGVQLPAGASVTFPDLTSQTTAGLSPADAALTYYPLSNPSAYVDAAGALAAVPDATDTVKGKVELATNAEAIAGTDADKAVTPSTAAKEMARRFARRRFQTSLTTFSTQVNGTGAAYAQVQLYTNIISPNITTAGYSRSFCIGTISPENFSGSGDWAKPIGFGCTTSFSNHSSQAGHAVRCGLGYTSSPTAGVTIGDLAVRGFGFYWLNGGNVFLQVHDGTTLRNIDTGFTPTSAFGKRSATYLEAYSDGNGNVTAYIRAYVQGDYPVSYAEYTASSSNGPTGALVVSPNNGYLFQASTGTTHTATANYGGMHPVFFYD